MMEELFHLIPCKAIPENTILLMSNETPEFHETTEGFLRRLIKEGKVVILRNIKIEVEE